MTATKDALLASDRAHLIHPLHSKAGHQDAHVWVKAHGSTLVDADDRQYLDGLSGLWNVVAGHGRSSPKRPAGR